MNKHLMVLNILFAIGDVLICTLVALAFVWASWAFSKWWVVIFTLVPLAFYCNHSIIIESDIQQARLDELRPEGEDEKDG